MMSMEERVAGLEVRIGSHEDHCDERHEQNRDHLQRLEVRLDRLDDRMGELASKIVVLILSTGGMLVVGLYLAIFKH